MDLKSFESSFLYWGCGLVESHTAKRKIFYTNAGAVAGIVSILVYSLLYASTGNAGLLKGVIAISPFHIFLALVFWTNRLGHAFLASWLLSLSVMGATLSVVLFSTGSYLGVHFYFIMFAVTVLAFFPHTEWRSVVFIFVLNTSLYVWFQTFGFEPDPEVLKLDRQVVTAFHLSYFITTFATIFFIMWLEEYVTAMNEMELDLLSGSDALTQLPNRRALNKKLAWTIALCKRSGKHCGLMLLDLDNFKTVNDTHGHDAGDLLLIETAHRLSRSIREVDTVARLGGDEFVVLLHQLSNDKDTSLKQTLAVASKIRTVLNEPYRIILKSNGKRDEAIQHHCGASIGITVFNGNDLNLEDIIKRADVAMYLAKSGGKNSIQTQAD
jgi:diguanylate cyclase (GGDEF)-like protein